MVHQPCFHIRGNTNIEVWDSARVFQHVDKSFVSSHGPRRRQTQCRDHGSSKWAESRRELERLAVSASDWNRGAGNFCPPPRRFRRRTFARWRERSDPTALYPSPVERLDWLTRAEARSQTELSRLRGFAATARHPSPVERLTWFTEPKLAVGERRMVDQTGIEPVTS